MNKKVVPIESISASDLDFDDGEARTVTLQIMPEQLERIQHFARHANVSVGRFLREGAELLASEMTRTDEALH